MAQISFKRLIQTEDLVVYTRSHFQPMHSDSLPAQKRAWTKGRKRRDTYTVLSSQHVNTVSFCHMSKLQKALVAIAVRSHCLQWDQNCRLQVLPLFLPDVIFSLPCPIVCTIQTHLLITATTLSISPL